MFHCSLSNRDRARLLKGGNPTIIEDHARKGLYATIWQTLWDEGLQDHEAAEGNAAANAYWVKLRSQEERKQARAQKKKARAQKKKHSR
jgi:hypothetical protein